MGGFGESAISSRWSDMNPAVKVLLMLLGASVLVYAGYVVLRPTEE